MSTWEKIKFSTTAFLGKILEKLFPENLIVNYGGVVIN